MNPHLAKPVWRRSPFYGWVEWIDAAYRFDQHKFHKKSVTPGQDRKPERPVVHVGHEGRDIGR